jgi:hypothetical protein
MSTDEMIQEDIREAMGFESRPKQPRFQPAVPQKAVKNVFDRLRSKKAKARIFMKAVQFAGEIMGYGVSKSKSLQRSVLGQYGLSIRETRAAIQAAKPKKHRRR